MKKKLASTLSLFSTAFLWTEAECILQVAEGAARARVDVRPVEGVLEGEDGGFLRAVLEEAGFSREAIYAAPPTAEIGFLFPHLSWFWRPEARQELANPGDTRLRFLPISL